MVPGRSMRQLFPTGNVALILGHPAHVLRVYRFIELVRPVIYILTDGSGSSGESRAGHVTKLLSGCGARSSGVMCRFTDGEMYRVVCEGDTGLLRVLVDEIVDDLGENDINVIAGDAIEGFNPIHDLCRYLTNAIATIHARRAGRSVHNYDFLLDGPPDIGSDESVDGSIRIRLTDDEFERKMASIREYPGIETDVKRAMELCGEAAFRNESLRPVTNVKTYCGWDTDLPYYESYGAEMVEKGVYSELITYHDHLLPLAQYLTGLAASQAAVA